MKGRTVKWFLYLKEVTVDSLVNVTPRAKINVEKICVSNFGHKKIIGVTKYIVFFSCTYALTEN